MGQTSTEELCQWETFVIRPEWRHIKGVEWALPLICYAHHMAGLLHPLPIWPQLWQGYKKPLPSASCTEDQELVLLELSWSSLFHYVIYRNKFLIKTPVTPRQPMRRGWHQQAEIEFKYLSGDNLPGIKLIHGKLLPDRYLFPMITSLLRWMSLGNHCDQKVQSNS